MVISSSWTGAAEVAHYLKVSSFSKKLWRLRWKPVCASTELDLSRWLLEHPIYKGQSRAVIAKCQRYGIGQFKRTWFSPKGGVWISAAFSSESFLQTNQLFGLSVAEALAERMEKKGIYIKIKWPNDLTFQNRKLAGLLPKLFYRGDLVRLARVGIGLNVYNHVPKGGISLAEICGYRSFNLAEYSAEVLIALERAIELMRNKKELLNAIESRLWAKEVLDPKNGTIWLIKGIDDFGRLKLSQGSKEITWSR